MKRNFFALLCLAGLVSFLPAAQAKKKPKVTLLSPQVIVDREGFGRPVEAYSILVPKGWKFESNLSWFGGQRCGAGYAQPVFRMTSPDGRYSLEMHQSFKIELIDMQLDPQAMGSPYVQPYVQQQAQIRQQMQATQQQYARIGPNCQVGRANDIREFATRVLLPALRPNSRVVSSAHDAEMAKALSALATQLAQNKNNSMPGMMFDAGMDTLMINLVGKDPSGGASEERMRFALITNLSAQTVQSITEMGNMANVGLMSTTEQKTNWIISYRAPKGELQKFEATAAAIGSSMRVNPVWDKAFNQFIANMNRINQKGAQDRSRILANAASAVSDIQMKGWRNRQAIQDKGAANTIDGIAGVERRVDPNTGSVYEVPNTASGYYSNGKGTIAIVDEPGVNPADLFPNETWTSMKKAGSP